MKIIHKPNNLTPIAVKLAGGAAAQTLALMNALYLKTKLNRDFQLFYYPHSTGTYWPFAISFLLNSNEIGSVETNIRTFNPEESLQVGKIIRSHPLAAKKFSYEKILSVIRRFGLDKPLLKLRGEYALVANNDNLNSVPKTAKSVSGGFVPINNAQVNSLMDARFKASGKKSPFSLSLLENERPDVVIHFRIGDKRANYSVPLDFGSDGISDPIKFKEIIDSLKFTSTPKVLVLSDEPAVAQSLLSSVGIESYLNQVKGDLWDDLFLMSQAKLFIGSWSQVSQVAALCVVSNGGTVFLPSTTRVGAKVGWDIPEINYFQPKLLGKDHEIYAPDFNLEDFAHRSYGSQ